MSKGKTPPKGKQKEPDPATPPNPEDEIDWSQPWKSTFWIRKTLLEALEMVLEDIPSLNVNIDFF